MPSPLIVETLRRYGAKIGDKPHIKSPLWIDNAFGDMDCTNDFPNLEIGDRVNIGKGCTFDLPDRIVIEDEVVVNAQVTIYTHHGCGDRPMTEHFPRSNGPVTIKRGSWIGGNVAILKDVTIGPMSVVSAGSIVNKDVPPNTVYGGVPARKLRDL